MASRKSVPLLGLAALVLGVTLAGQWWQGRAQARAAAELAEKAGAGDIQLLSSETCAYCAQARAFLKENGVPFEECIIERDPDCATLYGATGARGTPTVLVRGRPQLGFSPERVRQALQAH